jgi:hypothetical protein
MVLGHWEAVLTSISPARFGRMSLRRGGLCFHSCLRGVRLGGPSPSPRCCRLSVSPCVAPAVVAVAFTGPLPALASLPDTGLPTDRVHLALASCRELIALPPARPPTQISHARLKPAQQLPASDSTPPAAARQQAASRPRPANPAAQVKPRAALQPPSAGAQSSRQCTRWLPAAAHSRRPQRQASPSELGIYRRVQAAWWKQCRAPPAVTP